jgi:ferredoxin
MSCSGYFNGTEQSKMFQQLTWLMLLAPGEDHDREGRKDYTDKSDSIREHDCIWCMACVSVCPPQAIKVDQSNLEYHEKSAGTFDEELAKGSAPPPHAH